MVIVFDSVSLHMFLEAIVSVILCLSIGRTIGRAFGVVKQGEVVYEPSMLIYDFPLTIRGLLLWVGVRAKGTLLLHASRRQGGAWCCSTGGAKRICLILRRILPFRQEYYRDGLIINLRVTIPQPHPCGPAASFSGHYFMKSKAKLVHCCALRAVPTQ